MNDIYDPRISRQWAMFMHFSVLLGYLLPVVGLVAPIIMWQMKKDEFPEVDEHGKNIVNFLISLFVYSLISGLLVFVLIGIFMLMALSLASVVLPIVAGIKANNGEVWKYPLTLKIL